MGATCDMRVVFRYRQVPAQTFDDRSMRPGNHGYPGRLRADCTCMNVSNQAETAKYGTGLIISYIAASPVDWRLLIVIPLGLMLGWMARAGRMVGDNKPWSEIRRDLTVSLLIGGANGLLAALVIWWLKLSYLPGLAVAFMCAFGGVQSLDQARKWATRQIINDETDRRQQEQLRRSEQYLRDKLDLQALAREVERKDEENG